MINFTPLMAMTFLRDVIRQFFKDTGGPDLFWDPDPKVSKIWIGTANDTHQNEAYQKLPRILLKRGSTVGSTQFISDNLEVKSNKPNSEHYSRLDCRGVFMFIIEASEEGTCEILCEALRRLIIRMRPLIEGNYGFLEIGKSYQFSECDMDSEDKEKFKIQGQIPFVVEDRWYRQSDEILLKQILLNVQTP